MLFDLQVASIGDWQVVAPIGELDLASIPQVRQLLVQRIGEGDRCFVLDLSGVDFMDSAGLGLLVMAAKRIAAHGGTLRLARVPDPVWSLLELVGLDRVWTRYGAVDEALAGSQDVPTVAADRTAESASP